MGTVVTIDIYLAAQADDAQAARARRQLDPAIELLHQADQLFSTWKPDSAISRLRREELTAAQAPAEVMEVAAACARAKRLSGGWFDPWAMPGGFDPTGLVKGWAAQRALAELLVSGVSGAIVNAAGDIASAGRLAAGQAFRIGIADPAAPNRLAEVIQLTGAVATSGGYHRPGQLIDPRSGEPAAQVASASVTGPDLGLADALATAVAVAGHGALEYIDALTDYQALIIDFDGSRVATSGFPFARAAR